MPRASSGEEDSACGRQNRNVHVRYEQTPAAMGRGEIARELKKYFSSIANFQNSENAKSKNQSCKSFPRERQIATPKRLDQQAFQGA
jgi:hypothetical protein